MVMEGVEKDRKRGGRGQMRKFKRRKEIIETYNHDYTR